MSNRSLINRRNALVSYQNGRTLSSSCFVMDVFSYSPDFYLYKEQRFVEIKGHLNCGAGVKLDVFRRHYASTKLTVLMGDDLQKLGILDSRNQVIRKEREAA